jgi:type II secretory pathway component PulK
VKNKKGIILIFVLMTLATFSLLGIGLAFRSRVENRLSQYFAAEYENLYLAKSKLNQVMAEIAQDDNDYDGFDEEWAIRQSFNLEGGGSFKMVVEDEDGKLDINTATSEWISNLFVVSEHLKDQIIKNRPFLVEEEMFYLEDFDDNFSSVEEKLGILNLVTTQSHDKININTVREEVLYSMPGLSRSVADTLLSLRKTQPIDNLEVLKEVAGISVSEYQTLNKVLKTTSTFYTVKIQIDDEKNKIDKSFRVVLKKDPETKAVKIVRWLEQ